MVDTKYSNEDKILLQIAQNVSEDWFSDNPLLRNVDNVNWEILFEKANHHKIFLLTYARINEIIPDKYKQIYENRYDFIIEKRKKYISELKYIIEVSKRKKVDFILVKGLALSESIYNNLYERDFGDLDILVSKDQTSRFCDILSGVGYKRSVTNDGFIPFDEEISTEKGIFHEYWYYRKVGKNNLLIEVKNSTSAIPERLIDQFFYNRDKINIENFEVDTLDITHNFLHLCANTYSDTEKRLGVEHNVRLRDYIDVYMYI
ncbi:hypothetical protein J416_15057 [Gracilibacillus halophilus YIM-C55.5]|uniref:Uncharacterized protein n=1 Tax=Gracilibacillus halophilus YIM-C55.5 TaxID=1308866 RepID=N4WHH0_9BACI|nr:nucleotidyltransferase family protein [Gracilibacillus halophilus]ENH95627.1 hypothetical protein J416_15057 [Gracilibacillus halophilus YIM-C55.5]